MQINPVGPSQNYPGSSQPIRKDPRHVDQNHQGSDLDSSIFAKHHSLGPNTNQASPGDHIHDGSNSRQFQDLSILGILTAGNIAWGAVNITPAGVDGSGNPIPTSAPVNFNIDGTTFVGFTTANSGVPGVTVLATSITAISNIGATVWIARKNTTLTTVYWLVIGI